MTQTAEPVKSMFDVPPQVDESGNVKISLAMSAEELARHTCAAYNRFLKQLRRDSELWRDLQARRYNRWYRRLWRRIRKIA